MRIRDNFWPSVSKRKVRDGQWSEMSYSFGCLAHVEHIQLRQVQDRRGWGRWTECKVEGQIACIQEPWKCLPPQNTMPPVIKKVVAMSSSSSSYRQNHQGNLVKHLKLLWVHQSTVLYDSTSWNKIAGKSYSSIQTIKRVSFIKFYPNTSFTAGSLPLSVVSFR